jgi:hypothetical protein
MTLHLHESRLMRRTGEIQVDYNARTKFSDCFTGSRKSFIIKGRGSSVVEQPIRKPSQDNENEQDT